MTNIVDNYNEIKSCLAQLQTKINSGQLSQVASEKILSDLRHALSAYHNVYETKFDWCVGEKVYIEDCGLDIKIGEIEELNDFDAKIKFISKHGFVYKFNIAYYRIKKINNEIIVIDEIYRYYNTAEDLWEYLNDEEKMNIANIPEEYCKYKTLRELPFVYQDQFLKLTYKKNLL